MAETCARHGRPGRPVRYYPCRHAEAEWRLACVLCVAAGDKIDDWVGSPLSVDAAWASWRHEFRTTEVPGFDPQDLLWREIESTPAGELEVLGTPYEIARRWAFMARTGLTDVQESVALLEQAERLLGWRAFEQDADVLRETCADSVRRWQVWFGAIWDRLDDETRAAVLRVGPLEWSGTEGWPEFDAWMERLDAAPMEALVRLRRAQREVESLALAPPTEADRSAWLLGGPAGEPEDVILALVRLAGGELAADPPAEAHALAPAPYGPNTSELLDFLEEAHGALSDDLMATCLRLAWSAAGPRTSARDDLRSTVEDELGRLRLRSASFIARGELVNQPGTSSALTDRALAIIARGLVDEYLCIALSAPWADAVVAAAIVEGDDALRTKVLELARGWKGSLDELLQDAMGVSGFL